MNNRILSRRGSTLIEMIIAMALLSIVSVMIVSFSAMAHSFTNDETQKHSFIDDCAAVRQDINDFLLTCDENGKTIEVASNGLVERVGNKNLTAIYLGDRVRLGERYLDSIKRIEFEKSDTNNRLLKCTVTGSTDKGQTFSQTFVFALRCAVFQ